MYPFDDEFDDGSNPFGSDPWDFLGGSGAADAAYSGGSPRPRLPLPQRPSIQDLLKPLVAPQYPLPPSPIDSVLGLSGEDRRRLTQSQLLSIAQAIAGGDRTGTVGTEVSRAVGGNLDAEREAIQGANDRGQQKYARDRAYADDAARVQNDVAKQNQDAAQVRSLQAVGDRAIELAGGPDKDPGFTQEVYTAMQAHDPAQLQKLLERAPQRRAMREKYGLDPDDPMGQKRFEAEEKAKADLAAKKLEETELGPLRSQRAVEQHQQERNYDVAHPLPVQREPQRDRMWFDPTSGQIINLDRGTAGSPITGYQPKPRDGKQFDEVEKQAIGMAASEMQKYNSDPLSPTDRNGMPIPFDLGAAVAKHEKVLRKIADQKAAALNKGTPVRDPGAPPAPPPARGVQNPKGAPVGVGGNAGAPPKKGENPASKTVDVQQKTQQIAAAVGTLTPSALRKVQELLAAGSTPEQIIQLYNSRKRAQ